MLEVAGDDGDRITIGRGKETALLAILLLHANEPVSIDRLRDELFGEASQAAAKNIQIYVSRLRKSLGEQRLTTTAAGYVLRVEPGELDIDRFEQLAIEGRQALAAGDYAAGENLLTRAVDLWRGEPLAEFEFEQFAQAEIRRLEELRAGARADLVDVRLELGQAVGVVAELEQLIEQNPLWERPRGQLMLALYQSGRQAEALEVYRATRTRLADELGIEPTPELQTLEREILNHDPRLKPVIRASPEVVASPDRKSVTNVPWSSRRFQHGLVIGGTLLLVAAAAAAAGVELSRGSDRIAIPVADSVAAYNLRSGKLIAAAPVRTGPSAVAVGAGGVWTANVDDDSVSRINPQTNSSIQTITVENAPSGIAVGGGFVWVTNSLAGTVSKIDPNLNGGSVVGAPIRVGNGPSGIAYGDGGVWVANSTDRTVQRIDPVSGTAGPPIQVADGADGIAFGDAAVWVTSESDGSLSRIDPRTRIVSQPINVGHGADAVAVGPGAVWVANSLDGTVNRVDPTKNIVSGTITGVGAGPSGIAVTPDGKTVWVSSETAGTLSKIDPRRNTVVRTVATGNRPEGITISGNRLYVAVKTSQLVHRGGTLSVLLSPDDSFDSIDPAVANTTPSWSALILTNDGLVTFKRVGGSDGTRLEPDLATTIPTPTNDGETYTFQVRRGIRYSNGALVEPADFRRGIERSVVGGTGYYFSVLRGYGRCLKTPKRCDLSEGIVTEPASNTVTFHLTAPDPDFLQQLAQPDADAVPANTPVKARLPLPATGPYEISSYDAKRGIRLVRNPRFHEWYEAAQPDGYPDQIVWRFNVPPSAQRRAVEQGTADVANDTAASDQGNIPAPATLTALRTRYASRLHRDPSITTLYVFLNTRVPPFNNLKARQAVNYAVDRNRMNDLRGGSTLGLPTCQVLPPNINGYQRFCPYTIRPNADGSYTGPNLAKAHRLVAESGTSGQRVTVAGRAVFQKTGGEYLVSVLKSLGYTAHLRTFKTRGAYFAAAKDSRQKIQAGIAAWQHDYPTAGDFLPTLLTCNSFIPHSTNNQNLAEFCNHRIDAEIARARSLEVADPGAASRLWQTVDHNIVRQAPWVFLQDPLNVTLVSRPVGNYQYNPQWGVLLDQLWVR